MEVKSDVCSVEGETQAGSDAEQVSPASADRVPNRIPLDGRRSLQTHAFSKENTISLSASGGMTEVKADETARLCPK